MKTVRLAGSAATSVPALGLGTWRLGESTRRRSAEVAARLADVAQAYFGAELLVVDFEGLGEVCEGFIEFV